MIADKQIVDAVAELYGPAPQFDDILWPEANDGICAALRHVDDETDLVIFRGSTTAQDWLRDFMAIPGLVYKHEALGAVHLGFIDGMDAAFGHFRPLLRRKVIVAGHSLGAGRGALFTGLLVADDPTRDVTAVLFGEPRSGCATLQKLVERMPYRSYRNAHGGRHDLVTDVPTDPPFCRNRPLIDVSAPPLPGDPWGPFSYHHIGLYQAALAPAAQQVA
jgi:hypothetical protein